VTVADNIDPALAAIRVHRVSAAGFDERSDVLAVEEPLEIRLGAMSMDDMAITPFR